MLRKVYQSPYMYFWYCGANTMIHLRNELNFWNVHGIMNTFGLLQSKWSPLWASLTLQETRSIHDSMNIKKKLDFLLIFTFYYKYQKYKNYF